MYINKAEVSMMDISRFVNETKQNRKEIIHAHAIIDWLGNGDKLELNAAFVDSFTAFLEIPEGIDDELPFN